MTVMILRERVQNGANLLDQKVPGWDGRINEYALNIAHVRCCVLGQLFSDYGLGLFKLHLEPWEGRHLGFEGDIPEMEILTHLWRDEIHTRHVERVVVEMKKSEEAELVFA